MATAGGAGAGGSPSGSECHMDPVVGLGDKPGRCLASEVDIDLKGSSLNCIHGGGMYSFVFHVGTSLGQCFFQVSTLVLLRDCWGSEFYFNSRMQCKCSSKVTRYLLLRSWQG